MKQDKKLKNIYLVGPSRCGKTSTASFLQNEYGYNHIIMDAIIETMSEVAPHLGIRHGNLESKEFKDFLASYSRNLFKYTKPNIIDLETLSPQFGKTLIDESESTIIYMGYPNISAEEKLKQMRQYDTKFDWTRNLSDSELLDLLNTHIETSKKVQCEATQYGFEFIDTSFHREEIIKKRINEIVKSGALDRNNKSYEKYYR